MSSAKFRSQLLELVDSDSEDGLSGGVITTTTTIARKLATKKLVSPVVNTKKIKNNAAMPPAKKRAGRQPAATAAANKVTKPAQKKRRAAAAVEEDDGASSTVLVEKSANVPPATTTTTRGRKRAAPAVVEEDDDDVEDTVMVDAPATAQTAVPKATTRGRPKKTAAAGEAKPEPPVRAAQRGRKAMTKKHEAVEEAEEEDETEIPETQQPQDLEEASRVELSEPEDDDDNDDNRGVEQEEPPIVPRGSRRNASAAPQALPSPTKRRPIYGSSASPSKDGGGDGPALRRRLGEMTQKYEALELRYRDLREIAVREAESNFDKLRKQGEEKSKSADELIASLKNELAAQREAAKETQRLRKQLEASDANVESLEAKVRELTTSLGEYKTEIKALNMKLTAARTAEAAAAAKVVAMPGSAMKANGNPRMMANMAKGNASSIATINAQKKEDLYGDLTGLIVLGIEREGDEDVYDCIQTGRNGSLHFKLAIQADPSLTNGSVTAEGGGGEDGPRSRYTPLIHPDRDRELMDKLPDYLTDEIDFPRAHTAKFYARVTKALTEH
ncbi:chromosome segregation protein Csm1/Pcs1-domain-containing protein [Apodospora peruviana]|uniref:Chromosome segregation protein Csm1/Pcs1-domain-containing protein n=1 Tax=Apodospora peruviana TaxID=516989 RepID=A0AAE0I4V6_9PEZI|nr:chromosome segregation protein Csm1/Pcs1-domain-containing protein [Apodospora peruviana]